MAWIAAIISAIAGGAAASNQQKAAKKANRQSGILDSQGYANALNSLKDYQGIGKEGALSLAQLMGLKGYRTPEEQELTQFLSSKPSLGSPLPGIKKSKEEELAGYSLSARTLGGTDYDWLGGGGAMTISKGKKRRGREAALQAAAQEAAYRNSLAAWEAKKAELEQKANASLVNYDPTAALRNTPVYQFRYDTGLNTVMNQQTGRQLSGRAAKELERYGQGFASNEFGNEFNRRLALATGVQSAATTAGNWSIGQGGNAANLALQSGNIDSQYYNDLNNVVQQGLGNYLTYRNRNQRRTPYSSSY